MDLRPWSYNMFGRLPLSREMGNNQSRNADEMVDHLIRQRYVHSRHAERAFRLVDRLQFLPPENRRFPHLPERITETVPGGQFYPGSLGVSAIDIYAQVLDYLNLSRGDTFLNVGTGSGYFSTLVGCVLGETGHNHGIEIYENLITYSNSTIDQWTQTPGASSIGWAPPDIRHGDIFDINFLSAHTEFYDRIYISFVIRDRVTLCRIVRMLKIGGILVLPMLGHLTRYTRISETHANCEILASCVFSNAIKIEDVGVPRPPTPHFDTFPSLQSLCRRLARQRFRAGIYTADAMQNINRSLRIHPGGIRIPRIRVHRDNREARRQDRQRMMERYEIAHQRRMAQRPAGPEPAAGREHLTRLSDIIDQYLNEARNDRRRVQRNRTPPTRAVGPVGAVDSSDYDVEESDFEEMTTAEREEMIQRQRTRAQRRQQREEERRREQRNNDFSSITEIVEQPNGILVPKIEKTGKSLEPGSPTSTIASFETTRAINGSSENLLELGARTQATTGDRLPTQVADVMPTIEELDQMAPEEAAQFDVLVEDTPENGEPIRRVVRAPDDVVRQRRAMKGPRPRIVMSSEDDIDDDDDDDSEDPDGWETYLQVMRDGLRQPTRPPPPRNVRPDWNRRIPGVNYDPPADMFDPPSSTNADGTGPGTSGGPRLRTEQEIEEEMTQHFLFRHKRLETVEKRTEPFRLARIGEKPHRAGILVTKYSTSQGVVAGVPIPSAGESSSSSSRPNGTSTSGSSTKTPPKAGGAKGKKKKPQKKKPSPKKPSTSKPEEPSSAHNSCRFCVHDNIPPTYNDFENALIVQESSGHAPPEIPFEMDNSTVPPSLKHYEDIPEDIRRMVDPGNGDDSDMDDDGPSSTGRRTKKGSSSKKKPVSSSGSSSRSSNGPSRRGVIINDGSTSQRMEDAMMGPSTSSRNGPEPSTSESARHEHIFHVDEDLMHLVYDSSGRSMEDALIVGGASTSGPSSSTRRSNEQGPSTSSRPSNGPSTSTRRGNAAGPSTSGPSTSTRRNNQKARSGGKFSMDNDDALLRMFAGTRTPSSRNMEDAMNVGGASSSGSSSSAGPSRRSNGQGPSTSGPSTSSWPSTRPRTLAPSASKGPWSTKFHESPSCGTSSRNMEDSLVVDGASSSARPSSDQNGSSNSGLSGSSRRNTGQRPSTSSRPSTRPSTRGQSVLAPFDDVEPSWSPSRTMGDDWLNDRPSTSGPSTRPNNQNTDLMTSTVQDALNNIERSLNRLHSRQPPGNSYVHIIDEDLTLMVNGAPNPRLEAALAAGDSAYSAFDDPMLVAGPLEPSASASGPSNGWDMDDGPSTSEPRPSRRRRPLSPCSEMRRMAEQYKTVQLREEQRARRTSSQTVESIGGTTTTGPSTSEGNSQRRTQKRIAPPPDPTPVRSRATRPNPRLLELLDAHTRATNEAMSHYTEERVNYTPEHAVEVQNYGNRANWRLWDETYSTPAEFRRRPENGDLLMRQWRFEFMRGVGAPEEEARDQAIDETRGISEGIDPDVRIDFIFNDNFTPAEVYGDLTGDEMIEEEEVEDFDPNVPSTSSATSYVSLAVENVEPENVEETIHMGPPLSFTEMLNRERWANDEYFAYNPSLYVRGRHDPPDQENEQQAARTQHLRETRDAEIASTHAEFVENVDSVGLPYSIAKYVKTNAAEVELE